MPRFRWRDRRGHRPTRKQGSILSRLKALGSTVRRRTFPVLRGARTIDRKVIARVRGVESAPLTHLDHYRDSAAFGRAFKTLTRPSDAQSGATEPPEAKTGT